MPVPDSQPKDHSTVSAYMMTTEADRLIGFLKQVFAADVVMRLAREDGSVMHASVRIGDSVVMLADATGDFPAFPAWLHVYVADVDATYAKALSLGGGAVQAPTSKGDGDRRGGFTDPSGNTWWVATPEPS
jgi:PhnB protein